jgi:serine protease
MNAPQKITGAGLPPRFEGFAVEIVSSDRRQDLERRVKQLLGAGWSVQPFGDRGIDFEITDGEARSLGEAWQDTYKLRALPGVAYAEPLFQVQVSGRTDERPLAPPRARRDARATRAARSAGGDDDLASSNDVDWSLDMVRVFEAWDTYFPGSDTPGAGIVIGHPDTGFRPHPEIASVVLSAKGFDFVDDDNDATDPMPEEPGTLIPNPGHGTATSSVIVSPKGAQGSYQTKDANGRSEIRGIAPGARLIPLRVANTVVLFSTRKLARAIEYAADNGAHVISISMGGLFSFRLKSAISYAQKRGVIVCAAAGNQVRFVVWPAAYDEVIAVAACNVDGKVWRGSSRGSKVDVTAPGESVWRAHVDKRTGAFEIGRGSGTSYAVATTAGVAALWLARHGRDALAREYGLEKIPFIFNQILRESARRPSGWDTDRFGTGIVDATKTLAAPLPNARVRALRAPGPKLDVHPPQDRGERATFAHLFEESVPAGAPAARTRMSGGDGLDAALAALLRVPLTDLPAQLDEVGQELAFHLATDPALYDRLEKAIKQRRPAGRAAATRARGSRAVPPSNVRATRARLRASDASPTLKERLGR